VNAGSRVHSEVLIPIRGKKGRERRRKKRAPAAILPRFLFTSSILLPIYQQGGGRKKEKEKRETNWIVQCDADLCLFSIKFGSFDEGEKKGKGEGGGKKKGQRKQKKSSCQTHARYCM